jgi:hypothetical protein
LVCVSPHPFQSQDAHFPPSFTRSFRGGM